MKKAVLLALVFGGLALGVCWWKSQHAKIPPRVAVVDYESDMTEQLLRGIFPELDPGNPPFYFLAFGETRTQPSQRFITRFADHVPRVLVFTDSVSTPNGLVFDTMNGRPGVIIQIISFREIKPGEFDYLVAFSNKPPGHDRFVYRLFNIGGDWKITSHKPA